MFIENNEGNLDFLSIFTQWVFIFRSKSTLFQTKQFKFSIDSIRNSITKNNQKCGLERI